MIRLLATIIVLALGGAAIACGGDDEASAPATSSSATSVGTSPNASLIEDEAKEDRARHALEDATVAHLRAHGWRIANEDDDVFRYQRGDLVHERLDDLCAVSLPDGIDTVADGPVDESYIRDPSLSVGVRPIEIADQERAFERCLRLLDRALADFKAPAAVVPQPLPGGDEASAEDEEALRSVYRDFTAALLAGDGDEACSYLTDEAQEQTIRENEAARAGGNDPAFPGDTCEEIVAGAGVVLRSFVGESPAITLKNIRVEGDRATAITTVGDSVEETSNFERADGQWRIASF